VGFSAEILDSQVAEERIEHGEAALAAGTYLALGHDLSIRVECASVEDPIADALETELADCSGDAHLVSVETNAEKRAENRARGPRGGLGEIVGGTTVAKVKENGHKRAFHVDWFG
jgi:hypothetical protein